MTRRSFDSLASKVTRCRLPTSMPTGPSRQSVTLWFGTESIEPLNDPKRNGRREKQDRLFWPLDAHGHLNLHFDARPHDTEGRGSDELLFTMFAITS